MLSTRPRLTFNEDGVCSACQWAEEKNTVVDWNKRKQELQDFCDKYKMAKTSNEFDVVVPVSGGKDSSTVAYKLKHQYNMSPLCVNVSQSVDVNSAMNERNLNNFILQGFDVLRLYPNALIERNIDKIGLVKYGQPYLGWLTAMSLAPIKIALKMGIPFIMYGEEGEVEYGGSIKLKNKSVYDIDDIVDFYLSGIDFRKGICKFSEKDLYWWLPPTKKEIELLNLAVAHWSYFENWNSYDNYLFAKKYIGLKEAEERSCGTYNNFAQTDSVLYPLHTYFMYLKFGFGRCTQDVCIDIRRGAITRKQGINIIKAFDEEYPEQYVDSYLEYFQMSLTEFENVIDKWANRDILEKRDGRWRKKFNIE
jgi:N-acetyl sugar amidotransferase